MVHDKNVSNLLVEGQQAKRRRLWWWSRQAMSAPRTLTDLPHEMLRAVLSQLPAHDVAIARAACSQLKMAGDAVLDSALSRLVARAEAQLAAANTEEYQASVAGDACQCHRLSHVSWTLAYVVQMARLLRANCARYLRSWPQAGTGESCSHHISFYGGLVLDEAHQVLEGAAQCQRERQLHMQMLHVGQLRRLVERWVHHFHSQVEPQLLAACAAGLCPPPGCKPLDLLDCCADVERHIEVSWDETGEWCSGRGRYLLRHTALRVPGGGCQLLSPRGQRSLHACLSRLASRSAQYNSAHPRVWQELLACRLIGTDRWAETASLQDQAYLMSLQRHSIFAEPGVWLDEEDSDGELQNPSEEGAEEDLAGPDEQEGEEGEQEEGDNEQPPALEVEERVEDEQVAEEEEEEEEEEGSAMQEQDNVAVEVRFTCRRHLAPLGLTGGPPPPQRLLTCESSERGSRGMRQPDLQMRLVFHCPAAPEVGHVCCLLQHSGRLRPATTGACKWFSCEWADQLQQPQDHGSDVIPPEEDG